MLFDVSPKEFQPGTTIQLNATILYAGTNSRFTGYNTAVEFLDFRSDGSNATIETKSDSDRDGQVILSVLYPVDGLAHAYVARIVPEILEDKFPQGVVSNPVQLTVANNTKIVLNATRPDPSSTVHYFIGRVVWNNTAVLYRPVNVTINQTCYYCGLTNASGYFSFSVDLKPVGNKATAFMVIASFWDSVTQPVNVMAWAKTPDGQDYAACTTVQFGYKPASKSLSLTVALEKTDVVDPDKTPEEMQQDAENSNQLGVIPRFSLSSPWFWLETTIRCPIFGLSLITCTSLFDSWLVNYDGFESLLYTIFSGATSQQVDVLTSAAVACVVSTAAIFTGGFIALLLTSGNVFAAFVVQMAYFCGFLAAMALINSYPDAYLSRAVLIAMGWTLLSIATMGATRIMSWLTSIITGADKITASVKCVINTLLGVIISTSILEALKVSLYHFTFYVFNLILGAVGVGMGYARK